MTPNSCNKPVSFSRLVLIFSSLTLASLGSSYISDLLAHCSAFWFVSVFARCSRNFPDGAVLMEPSVKLKAVSDRLKGGRKVYNESLLDDR